MERHFGHATFSQQLQINGTSNITSNWNVQITGITRFASSGLGVSDEAGSPTYDNSNGLTATFSTRLTSPGDWATYKIKVENLGSLNAVLSSIDMQAGTSNDITYYVNKNQNNENITDTDRLIAANDILNPTGDSSNLDEGYVYVTVKYNNYTGQTSPTGDNRAVSATVKLNFVQTNDSASSGGSGESSSTRFVYAYHTDEKTIGVSTETNGNADYTQLSSYNNSKMWFLKYELDEDDVIQNAWACMKYSFVNEPICLQGGSASYYGTTTTGNRGIIVGNSNTFSAQDPRGYCIDADNRSYCVHNSLNVGSFDIGDATAYDENNGQRCSVSPDGKARCYE